MAISLIYQLFSSVKCWKIMVIPLMYQLFSNAQYFPMLNARKINDNDNLEHIMGLELIIIFQHSMLENISKFFQHIFLH